MRSPCSPDNANAVASAVSAVVTRYTTARAGAKYIVLVGGDDQIPFFRLPDLATVSNESDYASTFLDHPNEYFGSLASGDVLSDNPYGTPRPTPFFDRFLYVPSLSVGRLVETPTDIVKAVNQFISSAGTLAPSTALVTGYDFLADGSQQVAATETTQRTAANVKTLIDDPASGSTSPPWSASSLDAALGTAPASVLSLNAHYDHYRLLPSDRGTLFNSSQMAAKSLTGRFVFTMGCHAGLSVSDIIVGASDSRHLDWAQVYGAGGALFAGNTGFGYGDTTGVAYSEKLMALLAKRLDGSLSAGDALTFAKNDFKASLGPIDVYDEKVISETTFYGLPMYRVGPAAALPPVPAPRPTAPDPDGRRRGPDGGSECLADADAAHVAVRVVLLLGRHRVDELPPRRAQHVHRRHGAEPRRPRRARDPARIDGHPELRRCLLDAHDRPDGDGSRAGLRRLRLPDEDPDGQTYADPRGQRQRLVLVAGQFAGDPSLAPGRGRQRNFTQIGARVYYAPPGATDFTPAQFGLVQGAQIGTQAAFSVHASDVGGTGVKRVVVAYHDGANWKFVDLQQSASDPTLWTGGGPSATVDPEFFVQAVDGAGNVSVTSYKGRYYLAPPPPTQTGGLAWSFAGTPGLNGWFTSNVTATVTGPAGTTLDLDGGPFGVASPLAVAGDGVHLIGIRVQDAVTYVPVGIDRTSPTIAVTSPLDGSTVSFSSGTLLRFACADAGSGLTSCAATLNGNPVANGADISTSVGAKTVVVTAKDAAGNTSTKTISFQVTWPFTGWLFPIKNPPAVNRIVPGWIIPMRFRSVGAAAWGSSPPGSRR